MFCNLKPRKIYYGWWLVAASFPIALYVAGAVFYGFTAIFEPIANEMGWSYTQISFAASIRGFEIGLLAPFMGIIVDRWGPRRLIFVGTIVTATGLILLSRSNSLSVFYGAIILMTIGMSCNTTTVLMTVMAQWFRRNIGLASGIAVSGYGFGGLFILVIVKLIELYDWRMAMMILASGILAVNLPLSLLFRHKPEQYGYLPDGQANNLSISDNGPGLPCVAKSDVKTRQAVRSGAFWRLALAYIYQIGVIATIATHVMPYLSSIGMVRSTSSLVATAIPVTSVIGRLVLGRLADKLNIRLIAASSFFMMGLGLLCFGYVSYIGAWLLIPCIVLIGIGFGGCVSLRAPLSRDCFGRNSFGAIFGLLEGISWLGSIIGPPLAGWVYDNWNSYQGIWFTFAAFSILPIISVLTIIPVRTRVE